MNSLCNQEPLASFAASARESVVHMVDTYSRITSLLTEAAMVVGTDKARAHKLTELACDLEYELMGNCDPSARVAQALLGDWTPDGGDL
jgi:hypothetical protein